MGSKKPQPAPPKQEWPEGVRPTSPPPPHLPGKWRQPLAPDQIDRVLERFDQTDAKLQREIIAKCIKDSVVAKRFLELLIERIEDNCEAAPHFESELVNEIREFLD